MAEEVFYSCCMEEHIVCRTMSNSGNGGCISFVLWLIISVIIGAIADSVWIGIIGGTVAILTIAYLLTKD